VGSGRADEETCIGQIRDRFGWRYGVLFSASADLLVAHTARLCLPRRSFGLVGRRYGALVERVRQARLDEDLDGLERACRDLVRHLDAQPVHIPLIRAAVDDLREMLAWLAADWKQRGRPYARCSSTCRSWCA